MRFHWACPRCKGKGEVFDLYEDDAQLYAVSAKVKRAHRTQSPQCYPSDSVTWYPIQEDIRGFGETE